MWNLKRKQIKQNKTRLIDTEKKNWMSEGIG